MFFQSFRNAVCGTAVSFLLLVSAHAQDVSINFIANGSLRISDGEYVLFTDFPYVSAAFGKMAYTYPYFVEDGEKTITLITNRMDDHFDPVTFMTLDWQIVAPAEVVGDLQERYFAANQARDLIVAELERNRILDQAQNPDTQVNVVLPDPINEPKTIVVEEKLVVGPMHIQAIETKSGETEHYSYIVEWHGKRMYFGGDTGDTAHLANLPETDVAFLSPWLYENARKENVLPITKNLVIYQHRDGEIIPRCANCFVPQKGQLIPID